MVALASLVSCANTQQSAQQNEVQAVPKPVKTTCVSRFQIESRFPGSSVVQVKQGRYEIWKINHSKYLRCHYYFNPNDESAHRVLDSGHEMSTPQFFRKIDVLDAQFNVVKSYTN